VFDAISGKTRYRYETEKNQHNLENVQENSNFSASTPTTFFQDGWTISILILPNQRKGLCTVQTVMVRSSKNLP
jgi:hypothetical protein